MTRRVTFAAAHVLRRPDWDERRNQEVFGQCAGDHGHNYVLEVSVKGPIDATTGYVFDLGKLAELVEERVIDKMDHKNMNLEVDFMRGLNPTTENIVVACWRVLAPAVAPGRLARLRLWETENNYVEYFGE